jgi:hypothetical protein
MNLARVSLKLAPSARLSHRSWPPRRVLSLKSALLRLGLLVAQADASHPEIVAKLTGVRAAAAAAATWRVPEQHGARLGRLVLESLGDLGWRCGHTRHRDRRWAGC